MYVDVGYPMANATLIVGDGGTACNTLEGRFAVRDLSVDASGVLRRIDIDFEQRCTNQSAHAELLTGTLRILPDA